MCAKVIAKCFWSREAELELSDNGIREKWIFTSEKKGPLTGTNDDVMEFIDRKRCEELYTHDCSTHCKMKGV
jgi:hypothetical protein